MTIWKRWSATNTQRKADLIKGVLDAIIKRKTQTRIVLEGDAYHIEISSMGLSKLDNASEKHVVRANYSAIKAARGERKT